MNRKSMQIFSIGWFGAACCIAAAYFILQPDQNETDISAQSTEQEQAEEQTSSGTRNTEEHIASLESDGYVVLTEEEYSTIQEENVPSEEEETNEVTAILHIEQGMTSGDVASLLQQLEMVEEGSIFQQQLQESGLASSIRPGQYKVNSTMSAQDIIHQITS
ncbi:endolytic transglycosylase MltG [Salibacterium qingdaonense]|uniref:YceG-like family protein n=1 Tax=Salibacterium qingdaonense TaxID=266892 RepID=A0A1I4JM28_9BACI|nr:endolytic transglycosylase MltG [Salibacterium qingdaonense]SFL67253.1 hypothetical protein SAMN04488054_103227 [Salibacterium qingdaonense]